jgi:hypothetical protein
VKKILKIFAVLAVTAVVTGFLVWKFYINKPKPDIFSEKTDFELEAADLYNAYLTSDSVLIAKYTDRIITVTGILDTIEQQDSLINVLFVFGKDDFGKSGIRCSIMPGADSELKSMKKGTSVTLKGINKGYNGSDVILESAILITP